MITDETNPQDWFLLAKERLAAADALRKAIGPSLSGVELLQEALERFLKRLPDRKRIAFEENSQFIPLAGCCHRL